MKYRLKETDLAFNPHELRGPDGEWVASPESAVKAVVKEAKYGPGKHRLPGTKKRAKADIRVKISGKNITLTKAVKVVGDAYLWDQRDAQGGDPADAPSIHEQNRAQVVAKCWNSSVSGESPDDEQYAASLWEQYQSPSLYTKINAVLRSGKKQESDDPDPKDLRRYVDVMFAKGGYDVEKPTTVYRALKSGDIDWAEKLKPGTTFSDSGLISTTAHSKFSRGWLLGDETGQMDRKEQPNDVVMEIHLPTGHRIVGGDPQFIETMLAPGTTFKITSSEKKTGSTANPLGGDVGPPLTYTHVVAEVAP